MFSESDNEFMSRAIMLARRGWNSATPNPRVGCVLVKDGEIIADGWHERPGEAHAEAMALAVAGDKARGSTAYITLEPCSFVGRTPACSQALINAGVNRVVCAMQDPHARVAGSGFAELREAGIDVQFGLLSDSAEALNLGYCKRQRSGMPYVTCKMAMSLDGRTAMANGESQWITGPQAREDVQRLRASSCAIITGINTVLEDDARLTVRHENFNEDSIAAMRGRQPLRVVLDSKGRCPSDAQIVAQPGNVLLHVGANAQVASALQSADNLQLARSNAERPELVEVLRDLADRQCNEVLIEAGPTLAGAFLQAGLIDELRIYAAGKLLGSNARPLFDLPLESMAEGLELDILSIVLVGDDIRIDARPLNAVAK